MSGRLRSTALALFVGAILFAPHTGSAAPLQDAREHTRRGIAAYERGAYLDADHEFSMAYALTPEPALLYNLARCRAALGRDLDAAETFERFARVAPPGPDRAEAEAQAAEARSRAATKLAAQVRPPTTIDAVPVARRRHFPYPAATALGALSLVGLAAALGTGLSSQARYDALALDCATACPADRDARAQAGERLRIASIATLAFGGAAGVAGAALLGVEWRRAHVGAR